MLRADKQRDKVNFYGTLDLHTGKEGEQRSEEMNATVSVPHLEQLLVAFPHVTEHPHRPIVLFWDRVSWHKGKIVQQFLETHSRLAVVNFPVGAPELNPQEHVWKATRQAVSHNHLAPKLPKSADHTKPIWQSLPFKIHSSTVMPMARLFVRPLFDTSISH